jgi:hypothetical protein
MFRAMFSQNRICGVDVSHSEKPVYVCAHLEKGEPSFEAVPAVPAGWDAAAALSPRVSLIRRIDSPFLSPGKSLRILPSLLDVQMPFSIEECVYSFSNVAPRDDGKITALACAARQTDIVSFLECSEADGIDPLYLDAEGLALWDGSVSESQPVGLSGAVAVLKVEGDGGVLVLGEGTTIASAHALSALDGAHLKRLLLSAFGAARLVDWRLCGSAAEGAAVRACVEAVGTEWIKDITVHSSPSQFLARAIARRALLANKDSVNLRAGAVLHPELEAREDRRTKTASAVLAGCGILIALLAFVSNIAVDAKIASIEAEFLEKAESLAGGSLQGAAGQQALQRAESSVSKKLVAAQPILAPFEPSPQVILRSISDHASREGLLVEVANVSPGAITVEGTAATWKAPESLRLLLISNGYTVKMDRQEALAEESVRFTITAVKGASG